MISSAPPVATAKEHVLSSQVKLDICCGSIAFWSIEAAVSFSSTMAVGVIVKTRKKPLLSDSERPPPNLKLSCYCTGNISILLKKKNHKTTQ